MTTQTDTESMSFIVNRKAFNDALDTLGPAVCKKSTLPILENVCIYVDSIGIELTATNLEIRASITLPSDAVSIEHVGMITANYKQLLALVKACKDETLYFSISTDNALVVTSDSTSASLESMPREEFPVAPEPNEKNSIQHQSVTLPVETFRRAVQLVKHAAQSEKFDYYHSSPVLQCVKVSLHNDVLTFVAGDKFRLAIVKETINGSGSWEHDLLIPTSSLIAACKQLPTASKKNPNPGSITIKAICTDFVTITHEWFCLYSRLTDGHYPEIERYIPVDPDVITQVNIAAFKNALETVKLTAKECPNNKTHLHVNGRLDVMAKTQSMAEPAVKHVEAQTTNLDGEEAFIYIDWDYLMDITTAHTHGSMQIALNRPTAPMKVTYADVPGFVSVIMPLHPERV